MSAGSSESTSENSAPLMRPIASSARSASDWSRNRSVRPNTDTDTTARMTAMKRLKNSVRRSRRLILPGQADSSVVTKNIAHAADGVDEPAFAVRLQLAAQVAYVNVHDVGAALVLGPDLGLDVKPLENPARIAGEQFQQLKFLGGQLYAAATTEHFTAVQVHDQVGHAYLTGDHGADAPQVGPDPGQQLLDRKRLDQVIIGAGIQAGDLVIHTVLGGQDDDGSVGGLADAPGDLKSVEYRQHQI